jgi:hypothetical protein
MHGWGHSFSVASGAYGKSLKKGFKKQGKTLKDLAQGVYQTQSTFVLRLHGKP